MLGGDISNDIPRRILVTHDYITYDSPTPKKFLGVVVGTNHRRVVSGATISALGRFVEKVDVRLELVVFGVSHEEADSVLAEMDKRSWQPFNYASGYPSPEALVSDLPFRSEVLGVIDIQEREAGYGSYGISLDYLARVI